MSAGGAFDPSILPHPPPGYTQDDIMALGTMGHELYNEVFGLIKDWSGRKESEGYQAWLVARVIPSTLTVVSERFNTTLFPSHEIKDKL